MEEERKTIKLSLGTAIIISTVAIALIVMGMIHCYNVVQASQEVNNYSSKTASVK